MMPSAPPRDAASLPVRLPACVCLPAAAACPPAAPPGKLKEFKAYLAGEGGSRADIKQLKEEVEGLASSFPMPGL